MIVMAHGAVEDYCKKHGLNICGQYEGRLEDYDGGIPVLVTDSGVDQNEYFYQKYLLLKRGVELVSIHHCNAEIDAFLTYLHERESGERKKTYLGRPAFGFIRRGGELIEHPESIAVARKIVKMRDAGSTYREIQEDPTVRAADGRKLSISTIQVILRNRAKYE